MPFGVSGRPRGLSTRAHAEPGGGEPPKPPPPAGGGDGGEGGDGGDEEPAADQGWGWKGWRDRVAADSEFPYKVFVEQFIGVGAAVLGDMSGRPNWGLDELDFVFSTIVVGSILNFCLMYFTAPVAGAAASSKNLITKLFSEHYLVKWGAPTGHIFERGFGFTPRVLTLLYKASIFGAIGFSAGIFGTTISNYLLMLRKRTDPTFELQNAPPPILSNSGVWALHMGISSNIRYHFLGGMDMLLQGVLPGPVFKAITSVVRTANNVVGGISFVALAKILKVQESAPKEEAKPAAA